MFLSNLIGFEIFREVKPLRIAGGCWMQSFGAFGGRLRHVVYESYFAEGTCFILWLCGCVCPNWEREHQCNSKGRKGQESEIANSFSLTASRVCMYFSETKTSSLPANTAGCLPLYTEAVHRFRHFKTLQTLMMCEPVPRTS